MLLASVRTRSGLPQSVALPKDSSFTLVERDSVEPQHSPWHRHLVDDLSSAPQSPVPDRKIVVRTVAALYERPILRVFVELAGFFDVRNVGGAFTLSLRF